MRLLARPLGHPGRVELTAGWQWGVGSAEAGEAPAWRDLSQLGPVAAAMIEAGESPQPDDAGDLDAAHWQYRLVFDAPELNHDWVLGLDGLATQATVMLNGEALLSSANMFRAHEVSLAGRLRPFGNELRLVFHPLADALAQRRARPRWRTPMVAHQQLRWWRTTLLGRTPGWSPPVATVGPWGPVWLEPVTALRPVALNLRAERQGDAGRLGVAVGFHGGAAAARSVQVRVSREGRGFEATLTLGEDGRWCGSVEVPHAAMWWPHTHGEPALYEAALVIQPGDAGAAAETVTVPLGPVGFRRLEIDHEDDGFRLRINDVPVFARGACWMPLDATRLHATPPDYDAALRQVRAAGLNMLRLPGCGVYEHPAFYDACDAHGVLVWQDLMFANMDYPEADAAFAADVASEVSQHLAGWQARPSLAVVCGNSEVSQQAAMWGASRELWAPALFHERLPALVSEHLPGVTYWPSSAWGGAFPFQPSAGTTSYYGVGAYRREVDDARTSGLRFATECLAFANLPNEEGLGRWRALNGDQPLRPHSPQWKARVPRDLGAGWDFDDVRDHYVERLFGERADLLRATQPDRHLALGRAASAEAITAAFSRWRAAGSRCGGALVWLLKDLQAGAGWGLLDELGQPKSGFFALARVCQPLHLGVTDDGLNGLCLHLTNESARARAGQVTVTLYRDGEVPVATGSQPWAVAARATRALPVQQLLDGFVDMGWAWRFGPPPADVLVATWVTDDGDRCERVHFIDPSAQPGGLPPPLACHELGWQASVTERDDGSRVLTVTTRRAARGVHLLGEGWRPDDDFFDLAPGAERQVHLTPCGNARRPWRGMVHAINARAPLLPQVGA